MPGVAAVLERGTHATRGHQRLGAAVGLADQVRDRADGRAGRGRATVGVWALGRARMGGREVVGELVGGGVEVNCLGGEVSVRPLRLTTVTLTVPVPPSSSTAEMRW